MERDNLFVQHILLAIDTIERFLEGKTLEEFLVDDLVQNAVIRQLAVIGEASRKLSTNFREKNNNIPWKNIIGMRDKLIHDYMGVDVSGVWNAAKDDLLPLRESLREE